MKQSIVVRAAALALVAFSPSSFAGLYTVSMDNVLNLANWATMDNGVGDLYDGNGDKQVEVTYTERVAFGNTAPAGNAVQFWNSLEYGDRHRAIFGNLGGTDVIEIEITGLNGNLIDLTQVIVGRWFPDGIDTLGSDWAIYDTSWNQLVSGFTEMTEFVDYSLDFNLGAHETVRFQLGDDNWDNGVIAFSYATDVADGVLDLSLDRVDDPTPEVEGSGPAPEDNPVPAPTTVLLLALGLAGLRLRGHATTVARS